MAQKDAIRLWIYWRWGNQVPGADFFGWCPNSRGRHNLVSGAVVGKKWGAEQHLSVVRRDKPEDERSDRVVWRDDELKKKGGILIDHPEEAVVVLEQKSEWGKWESQ